MVPVPDLVCAGHIVREMIHYPQEVKGPFLGGPPAYCAVAASIQGTVTGLVTKIGPDMPRELLDPLDQAGVDLRGLGRSTQTTASELIYDLKGNKEIRYPGKAGPIGASDVPEGYHGCRLIYVCTMNDDVPVKELVQVAALGRNSAVDLGGYGGVHMSKANRAAIASLDQYACGVSSAFHIVKASDEDLAAIFGHRDVDAAAREILACGPDAVVITAGSKGAFVYTPSGCWKVPAVSCRVVDTTGGGDTFMAGFLSEYLRSADPVKSAQWGSATAACVIEKSGGVRADRMPTHDQVQARVNQSIES
ncbi:MAG: carbohydrate kinase family protein [Planctomycetes bacterium]|nr:carbohydrate kinase family protein [Planctomycetota bacterium]